MKRNDTTTLKIRDLIGLEIDADVCNDVIDDLFPAFCGPIALTPAGLEHYADALDLVCEYDPDNCLIVVHVDVPGDDPDAWIPNYKAARRFFNGASGNISCEKYDEWFRDPDQDPGPGPDPVQQASGGLAEMSDALRMYRDGFMSPMQAAAMCFSAYGEVRGHVFAYEEAGTMDRETGGRILDQAESILDEAWSLLSDLKD